MGTHELPTPTEPAADLVEIVARIVCQALELDADELCADGGIEAWMVVAQQYRIAEKLAGRLVEPGRVAVPVEDLHVALTLAADSSPSVASSKALNRLCDAIAAARKAATSEEKAR